MKISYSIPTYLTDFTASENNRTKAKLKMFYIGETGDGRIFSEEFAEKLVQSLPNCPVVGFYSDVQDDFCGHNSTQYIYGIVPADAEYGFETDDQGVKWFITEVLLYTDRIDNIGEVAQKIVGHPHSLEMDPATAKYEICNINGVRKIRFTDASLLGLSVLGMEQKPAFKGSEFFTEDDDLREKIETFLSFLENKDRGASMNETFEKLYSFLTLSYGERESAIHKAVNSLIGDSAYAYVEQCFDDYAVFVVYDFEKNEVYYKKASYTIDENNQIIFGDFVLVFPRFVTKEEGEQIENSEEVIITENTILEENKEDEDEEKEVQPEVKEEEEEEENVDMAEEVVTSNEGEINEELQIFSEEANEETQEDNASNFAALSDSEREELEALRREHAELELLRANQEELNQYRLEKRINLVNSYKEELSAETIDSFYKMALNCDYEELEAKLAIEFVKVSKQNKKSNTVAFSFNGLGFNSSNEKQDTYQSLVARYRK